METKQKQIEEMAYSICPMPQAGEYITDCTKCGGNGDCMRQKFAGKFIEKGYRKASDVIDEFAEKVLKKVQYEYENYPDAMTVGTYHQLRKEIKELADEMKKEVEAK